VWENPYTVEASIASMETPLPESLTVVSPTWFRFNAETKELDSVASAEYVRWAQAQGVLVWPNVTDTSANPGITDILSDAAARRHIIGQLVHYVDTLGLDGLSINIENIWTFRHGPYFVQFMRELNIALGHRITLLAAMKVDPFVNPHYRHDLIALTVDFIALMTYDEHSGSSPVPGPVASLPWVQQKITEMLRIVPANQLLMGIPFYNRVWRTSVAENTRRPSQHFDMDRAVAEFRRHGVSWEEDADIPWQWDSDAGSYYAEFAAVTDGETLRHQLWLECPRSVGEKMQIYAVYNLAGIAGWNNGFTNQAVWELLGRYF
jgi:spore germination protein YaaH